jgi:hypothetical protein
VVDDSSGTEASGTRADSAGLDGRRGRGPPRVLGLQGTLFDDLPEAERPGGLAQDVGYRGSDRVQRRGITYRQLDYWARTGLVEPSVREASGSGTSRLYSFRDILVLKIVKKLLDAGISLQNIRTPSPPCATAASVTSRRSRS